MPMFETPAGNVLFIHVPKTGGSSIEAHLAQSNHVVLKGHSEPEVPCKSQHFHGEVLERLLHGVPLIYSFMIVRHPLDRIVSEFKYQTRHPWRYYRRLSFSIWLRINLRRAIRDPYYRDNHFRPQHEFEALAAEVFRFEDGLGPCFARLQSVAGIPSPNEEIRLKESRRKPVIVQPDDVELVRSFYRKDFDRYGYQG